MKEEEIKKMFDHINGLSPWNLWSPDTWMKELEEREFNDRVMHWVGKLKKENSIEKEFIGKVLDRLDYEGKEIMLEVQREMMDKYIDKAVKRLTKYKK